VIADNRYLIPEAWLKMKNSTKSDTFRDYDKLLNTNKATFVNLAEYFKTALG